MTLTLPPTPTPTDPAAALRRALEADQGHADPAPDFSSDGGITVFDAHGRWARLQPLGLRTRISLADDDGCVAEAEVDGHALIADIGAAHSAYRAVALAVDRENGPRRCW